MAKSRKLRFAWLVICAALGASALYWVLAPRGNHGPQLRVTTIAKPPSAAEQSRVSQVLAAVGGDKADASRRLIDLYVEWAGQSDALAARRAALNALFADKNLPRKLSSVLEALESDPTPPEDDPLWDQAVESLANVWKGDAATKGLDLMHTETRPRARRAVIASFAELANSDRVKALDQVQTQTLTNNFIDLFKQLPASQQPEVEAALRKVSGNDVADILLGKGLTNDDELEINRAYKRDLAATTQAIAQGRPLVNKEDLEEEPQ